MDREPEHDVFISHATEDKDAVVRPLASALAARGWRVWTDELELTIGDSLSRKIDQGLARSRFGVVVLSPAFFAKEWPQRELSGLVAREVDTPGTKVILPVWHEIDHAEIANHSPTLADRLGAKTSAGVDDVADRIAGALERADHRLNESDDGPEAVVQPVSGSSKKHVPGIPKTHAGQQAVVTQRPPFWEYLLFASHLMLGREALEDKWHDHELRMSWGSMRECEDVQALLALLSRESNWVARQIGSKMRIFEPAFLERAFGPDGEPGDPDRIAQFAGHVLSTYEMLMDWAAGLRNARIPEVGAEVVESLARFADGPTRQIRGWIDTVVAEMSRLPELHGRHREGDPPVVLTLTLDISIDEADREASARAWERLRTRVEAGDF